MFVFVSVVVTVWGSVGKFVVYRPLLKIVFLSLRVLKYVVCLCRGCDGCCVFSLYYEAWSCRCPCMGSVSVLSCRCCVSCVHPVAVLDAAFCMTCSLLMLVEDAIGDHTKEAINSQKYVCCSECDVVLNECNEPCATYRYALL